MEPHRQTVSPRQHTQIHSCLSVCLTRLIRLYQLTLSPLLGARCRFYPSCSHYGIEAIEIHGVFIGSAMTIKRICKCHPFHHGGYDPVPPKKTLSEVQP